MVVKMENRPTRILAISYFFPPVSTPRSIRLAILSSYMVDQNMADWTILCGDFTERQPWLSLDEKLLSIVSKKIKIVRVRSYENKITNYISRKYYPFTLFSNAYISWYPFAVHKIRELLKKNSYDILISFSSPVTSHLVAYKIRNEIELPWISFFSDPLSNSPIFEPDKKRNTFYQKIEKRLFTSADILEFPWKHTGDFATSKFTDNIRDKTYILPHMYSEKIHDACRNYSFQSIFIKSKFKILYSGTLYGNRLPTHLFEALTDIRRKNKNCYQDLQIILLGSKTKLIDSLIQEYQLSDVVKATFDVSYLKSIFYMQESDLLLVIDSPIKYSPFFPSKLVDYIGAQKPILGIASEIGPTTDILRDLQQPCITSFNAEDICDQIVILWKLWQEKKLYQCSLNRGEKFEVSQVAKLQKVIINELIK